MFFFKSEEEKVRSAIRTLVPHDVWDFCSHGGVTLVSNAWDTQLAIWQYRHMVAKSNHIKHFPFRNLVGHYLLFTDKKELYAKERWTGGIVGNLHNFMIFQECFATRPGFPLRIPTPTEYSKSQLLGSMDKPQDFIQVVAWCQGREDWLKKHF